MSPPALNRGSIWSVNLGRNARGTEIGAKQKNGAPAPNRPGIIISQGIYNNAGRVTVATVTDYQNGREYERNWGCALPLYAIKLDPSNKVHRTLHKASFVDCGMINTIFADQNKLERNYFGHDKIENDLDFQAYAGCINDSLRLDTALQVAIGNGVVAKRNSFIPAHGDVLAVELDGAEPSICLVISSTAMNLIKAPIKLPDGRNLNHIIVLPLETVDQNKNKETLATCPYLESISVKLREQGDDSVLMANCHEIHTIDWMSRNGKIIGRAANTELVNQKVRWYLGLPLEE